MKSVLTGQQIAPLLGPIYTPLKILGAVKQAALGNEQAVYWMEGNDADFEEVRHWHAIDKWGKLRRFTWEASSGGKSLAFLKVDENLVQTIKAFFDALETTAHSDELKELCLTCFQVGKTLAEANRLLSEAVFAAFPLKLFDPVNDEDFTRFSQDYLKKELEKTALAEQANAFARIGENRIALFRDKKGWVDRQGVRVEIEGVVLLPNLKTRSIIQDAYFSASHYIAGPGEEKYLPDLKSQYAFYGVKPAKVISRMRLLPLPEGFKSAANDLKLKQKDLLDKDWPQLRRCFLKQVGWQENDSGKQIDHSFEQLKKNFPLVGDKIWQAQGQQLKQHILGAERRQLKQDYQTELNKIESLSLQVRPYGKPAERVLNSFYYFNKYGIKEFLEALYKKYHFGVTTWELPYD